MESITDELMKINNQLIELGEKQSHLEIHTVEYQDTIDQEIDLLIQKSNLLEQLRQEL